LVLGARQPAANRDVLRHLHEKLGALDRGDLLADAGDNLLGVGIAFAVRLQTPENARRILGRIVRGGAVI